ncbi:MAG: hypothetical protein AAB436_04345 [Patescibacteria group bacterium]
MLQTVDCDIYRNEKTPLTLGNEGLFVVEFVDIPEDESRTTHEMAEVMDSALAGIPQTSSFSQTGSQFLVQACVMPMQHVTPDQKPDYIRRIIGWGLSSQVDYHSRGATMAVIDGIFVRSEIYGQPIKNHGVGSAILHSLLSKHDSEERVVVRNKPVSQVAQDWLSRLAFKDPEQANRHRDIKRGGLSLVPPTRPLSSDYALHGPSVSELDDLLTRAEPWLDDVESIRPNTIKNLAEE